MFRIYQFRLNNGNQTLLNAGYTKYASNMKGIFKEYMTCKTYS